MTTLSCTFDPAPIWMPLEFRAENRAEQDDHIVLDQDVAHEPRIGRDEMRAFGKNRGKRAKGVNGHGGLVSDRPAIPDAAVAASAGRHGAKFSLMRLPFMTTETASSPERMDFSG